MFSPGVVMLNDDPIGSFDLDVEDRVVITFYKGAAGVEETLEMAAEQGLHFTLQLAPDYPKTE